MSRGDDLQSLPEIPVIDAPDGPLQLAMACTGEIGRIVTMIRRVIRAPLLRWGDRYAENSLRHARNPYLSEIDAVARMLGQPGAYALNFSFELGCTTACRSPDERTAVQLYRTLDWPFRLGRNVVVARHVPTAGAYHSITWPGFLGVLTAVAPSRFAAAINQPPMAYSFEQLSLGLPIDWMVNRWRVRNATALPPAHLLRQAFERCGTYAEAKAMLTSTAVCIPVIYTLTGVRPDEGCIIERRERDAIVHAAPACIANHWLTNRFQGRPRGRNSYRRLWAMRTALPSLGTEPLGWLRPPVLNRLTRVAAELDANTGSLTVQGWHGTVAQTRALTLTGLDGRSEGTPSAVASVPGGAAPSRTNQCRGPKFSPDSE